ncbi:MAG: ABC transporter permease [Chloroflexota bacterium]|nr:MAG: ABC transporter permease [Chloroflexota bacterium]
MNHLRGVYTIWYRDILRFWHDKMRMISSITFPLLFLFVFGSGLSARMGVLGPGIDFTQFIFPGIIGMTVLMSSFMAGVSVVWDREFGFLKEVLVAPISRASVAVGKTLGSATVALLQGLLILLFAPLIGVSFTASTLLVLLPLMFLLAVSLGSLGVLLATRIRSMEAFQATMQMLMFPMVFLSGAFFPLQGLPAWMNIMVKFNPATYGIAPIRQIILGTDPNLSYSYNINLFGQTLTVWNEVAILAIFGVIVILLAMWSFSNQE